MSTIKKDRVRRPHEAGIDDNAVDLRDSSVAPSFEFYVGERVSTTR
jgi:hypothetical protein